MRTDRPHAPAPAGWRALRRASPARRGGVALTVIGGPRLLRAAICGLLDAQEGLRVVRSLASVEALEEVWRRVACQCDVVLPDVDDYGTHCIAAVDRLLALGMGSRIVLLCAKRRPELARCVETRPIEGVVLKQ
jgi:hypothetical protein